MTASTTISMEPVEIRARLFPTLQHGEVLQVDLNDEGYVTYVSLMLHGDPQDIARKLVEALMPIANPAPADDGFMTQLVGGLESMHKAGHPTYRASGAGVAWVGETQP